MFWADRIAGEAEKRFGKGAAIIIRDEKTVSGRVHVGSMRGVVIHGTVSDVLRERGAEIEFVYELNDFDAFDNVPGYLDAEIFAPHLGKPLYAVPSPEPSAENYAKFFGAEFAEVIRQTGFNPEFTWSSEMYRSGEYNDLIRKALEHPEIVRRVYEEVSGGKRSEEWLPLMVVCEQCGKVATTRAVSFDGKKVQYVCDQEASGAKGCAFEGEISPFDGNAKLPWKVEWAAKFSVYDVSVEGEGKDLATKGGARDVADHISRELFDREPPLDIPYEFLLIGGKRMSTSKGRGSSAKEIATLVPPKIFRLAILAKDYNQAVNFDPEGDTIPTLYDQYDKLAEYYWKGEGDDYARLFEFVHPASTRSNLVEKSVLPRFSQVAFVVQMPHMDIYREFPEADRAELDERAAYAKRWLEAYAPEKYVFKLQEELPEAARELSETQKTALAAVADYVEGEGELSGERLHERLHEIKEEQGLKPAEFFGALYTIFLGRAQGPQAGWFLASLPREFVLKRLREAASAQ